MIKEGVKITYNDGTTEFFNNRTRNNFWDDCNRIIEVESIREIMGSQNGHI